MWLACSDSWQLQFWSRNCYTVRFNWDILQHFPSFWLDPDWLDHCGRSSCSRQDIGHGNASHLCNILSHATVCVCVKLARTGHSWPKESLHALNRFVFCASPQHSFLKSSVTLSILSQSNSNWIPYWLGYHQPVFSKWFQTLPSINTPSRGTTCSCWPILC